MTQRFRLRYRRTFIDCDEARDDLSPRAHSEPPSLLGNRTELYANEQACQQDYVERLHFGNCELRSLGTSPHELRAKQSEQAGGEPGAVQPWRPAWTQSECSVPAVKVAPLAARAVADRGADARVSDRRAEETHDDSQSQSSYGLSARGNAGSEFDEEDCVDDEAAEAPEVSRAPGPPAVGNAAARQPEQRHVSDRARDYRQSSEYRGSKPLPSEYERQVDHRGRRKWDTHTVVEAEYTPKWKMQSKESDQRGDKKEYILGKPGPRSEPGYHLSGWRFDRDTADGGSRYFSEDESRDTPRGRRRNGGADAELNPDQTKSGTGAERSLGGGGAKAKAPTRAAQADEATSKSSVEAATLESMCGTWEGKLGIWTIQEDGRTLFDGGRMGKEYDLTMRSGMAITRGDGWTIDLMKSTSDLLVWTYPGEENLYWTRVHHTKDQFQGSRMDGTKRNELKSKMEASAKQMSDAWAKDSRISTAIAELDEIPRRIGDDMQKVASHVIDHVQTEVAAMSKRVRGSDWGGPAKAQDVRGTSLKGDSTSSTDTGEKRPSQWDEAKANQVVKNLEVIPTMVLNLLEARVGKAKATVRSRVQPMIENLSTIREEQFEDHEQLVSRMQIIAQEVEQIAGEAVEAAAQECRAHATRQLDVALAALKEQEGPGSQLSRIPEVEGEGAAGTASREQPWESWKAWDEKQELWPKSQNSGGPDSMQQAMAVVGNHPNAMPSSFTNQVVADELLRAKARDNRVSNPSAGASAPPVAQPAPDVPTNPGSIGHPDLCPRQCLYFAKGSCTNGNDCQFCHMPHPKRPVRFDKRHREILKKMPFDELLSVMMPVLKVKAAGAGPTADTDSLLQRLGELAAYSSGAAASSGSSLADHVQAKASEEGASALRRKGGSAAQSEGGSACSSMRHWSARSEVGSDANSDADSRASKRMAESLGGTLHAMGLRSLLAMIARLAPTDVVEIRKLLEQVLYAMHDRTSLAPGALADEFGDPGEEGSVIVSLGSTATTDLVGSAVDRSRAGASRGRVAARRFSAGHQAPRGPQGIAAPRLQVAPRA